jgi:hypothetical protein
MNAPAFRRVAALQVAPSKRRTSRRPVVVTAAQTVPPDVKSSVQVGL